MRATRVRYRVVAATVALAGVTYLDRVCVGVLAPLDHDEPAHHADPDDHIKLDNHIKGAGAV